MATFTPIPIQAGEINAQFQFSFADLVTGNPVTITGATITLVVTSPAIGNKAATRTTYACTVANAGTLATYTTLGTEFPSAGNYSIQAVYVGSLGTHHGPVYTQKVLANL